MPQARDYSLASGGLPPGAANAITDVAGVLVGHTTLISGAGSLQPGHGPVRTGVTVVLPHGGNLFREKMRAAVRTINGFGKALGFEQVRELGTIESPIALTNTLNVGLVADALVQHAITQSPEIGISAGSVYGHGSGDFVIAFSVAERVPHQSPTPTATQTVLADEAGAIDRLFQAIAESVEEAVLNSLCAAETVAGRDGHTAHALPLDEVAALVRRSVS
jgi:L-aminopeptidase/D-esterase-like protein